MFEMYGLIVVDLQMSHPFLIFFIEYSQFKIFAEAFTKTCSDFHSVLKCPIGPHIVKDYILPRTDTVTNTHHNSKIRRNNA